MTDLTSKIKKTKLSPKVYRALPEDAGVYLYFKGKSVIYVGKAINLRKRVASYFRINLENKTRKMISEAERISYIKVRSELEALLLEAKLIRKYLPKYNIVAKDDKHPLYILITKEIYPRILAVRKSDLKKNPSIGLYGPFPSSQKVRLVLKMIRRIFPYSDHKLGKRACIYSQIGLCNPCPNTIKMTNDKLQMINLRKKYLKNIRNIKTILDGKIEKTVQGLEKEMSKLSNEQKYEEALEMRNKIRALEYVVNSNFLINSYLENPNLADEIRGKEVGELKSLLESQISISNLNRIECFDVAHLAGTNATASMVTFVNGEAEKGKYRHFRIRQLKSMSDTDSLKEVIARRLRHLKDWGKPDLIIVDGGVGQVKAFTQVLSRQNIKIPVVGIAKHPDRLIVNDKKIKLSGRPLNLVSRMRDEAHRFARVYHHKLYRTSLLKAGAN